jgi:hypothetical protein
MRPKIFVVQFADGSGTIVQPGAPQPFRPALALQEARQSRQIQEKAQDYSGFGLTSQTPARKSAQLSRAPARAAGERCEERSYLGKFINARAYSEKALSIACG